MFTSILVCSAHKVSYIAGTCVSKRADSSVCIATHAHADASGAQHGDRDAATQGLSPVRVFGADSVHEELGGFLDGRVLGAVRHQLDIGRNEEREDDRWAPRVSDEERGRVTAHRNRTQQDAANLSEYLICIICLACLLRNPGPRSHGRLCVHGIHPYIKMGGHNCHIVTHILLGVQRRRNVVSPQQMYIP